MTTELIARLPTDQLGGARVFRPCTIGGIKRRSSEVLSGEDLASLPRQSLKALIDQRFIVAWPKGTDAGPTVAADEEVLVYNRVGTSTYDVVVGRRLNARPLSKHEAETLADKNRKPEAA